MKILLIFLLSVVISCQPSGKSEVQNTSIESFAKKRYTDNIHYLNNKNSTYTLCYSQKVKTALTPYPPLQFFVFDNQTQELIFEDNIARGSIKWIGKYKFEVTLIPGIVSIDQENNPTKYIYDVQLKKKTK